jgi:hypothetical protein
VKNFKTIAAAILASLLLPAASLHAIVLNFANLAGTAIDFSGGGFNFTSTNGYQFDITTVSGGTGDSQGLLGYVSNSVPFTIGSISSNSVFGMPVEQASVMGTGTLYIVDTNGLDLTGTIQWDNITTLNNGGDLDLSGSIDLTGLNYSGVSSSDLRTLALAGSAEDLVSFQFTSSGTLEDLVSTGGSTSYSGSISAASVGPTPEPTTLALFGAGLAGLLTTQTQPGLSWSFCFTSPVSLPSR